MFYKVEKKADGWYVAGERFASQGAATTRLLALLLGKAAPKKVASKPAAPKKVASKPARRAEKVVIPSGRARVRDRYTTLGGGLIETSESRIKQRPFVVVEVSPGKRRAFYMSTGTGGQTSSGEWNLFGGIADSSWRNALGWFIKPTEGKRVAKYADVSAFLTEKFGDDLNTAWPRIRATFPDAEVYSELVNGEPAANSTERHQRTREMGARLNRYLGKFDAIAEYGSLEAKIGHRMPVEGKHETVFAAGRVAFNPLSRRTVPVAKKNPGDAEIEVLVAVAGPSEGAVQDAAWDTVARYKLLGVTFRYTTEGNRRAVAVRFRFDPSAGHAGASPAAILNAYNTFLERRMKYVRSGEVEVVGYSLRGMRPNPKPLLLGKYTEEQVEAMLQDARVRLAATRKKKAKAWAAANAGRRTLGPMWK